MMPDEYDSSGHHIVWSDNESTSMWGNSNVFSFLPTPKWKWDVFGNGEMVLHSPTDFSWSMRLRAKVFLGSKFERL